MSSTASPVSTRADLQPTARPQLAIGLDATGLPPTHLLLPAAWSYARQQAPERSCAAASQALALIAERRSAMKLERVASARAWLEPWRTERFVRELDEQLGTVAAAI